MIEFREKTIKREKHKVRLFTTGCFYSEGYLWNFNSYIYKKGFHKIN